METATITTNCTGERITQILTSISFAESCLTVNAILDSIGGGWMPNERHRITWAASQRLVKIRKDQVARQKLFTEWKNCTDSNELLVRSLVADASWSHANAERHVITAYNLSKDAAKTLQAARADRCKFL